MLLTMKYKISKLKFLLFEHVPRHCAPEELTLSLCASGVSERRDLDSTIEKLLFDLTFSPCVGVLVPWALVGSGLSLSESISLCPFRPVKLPMETLSLSGDL